MEEKSVEIPKIKGPLREQDSIRALLELLEQQGMEQEKGNVIRMADHIDTMEMQLGTVLKELGEVKKQLGVMQESKVKLFAVNTIQKAEHQVKTLRFQVGEWKRKFVERAEQAVFDFKEKGKDALASAVKECTLPKACKSYSLPYIRSCCRWIRRLTVWGAWRRNCTLPKGI